MQHVCRKALTLVKFISWFCHGNHSCVLKLWPLFDPRTKTMRSSLSFSLSLSLSLLPLPPSLLLKSSENWHVETAWEYFHLQLLLAQLMCVLFSACHLTRIWGGIITGHMFVCANRSGLSSYQDLGGIITVHMFVSANRSGSVWFLGLFWWVQPHWAACAVRGCSADRHRAGLQERAQVSVHLHWRWQCGPGPRVWSLPDHGRSKLFAWQRLADAVPFLCQRFCALQVPIPSESYLEKKFSKPKIFIWRHLLHVKMYQNSSTTSCDIKWSGGKKHTS